MRLRSDEDLQLALFDVLRLAGRTEISLSLNLSRPIPCRAWRVLARCFSLQQYNSTFVQLRIRTFCLWSSITHMTCSMLVADKGSHMLQRKKFPRSTTDR